MAQKVVLSGKIIGVGPVEMVGKQKDQPKMFIVVEVNSETGDEQWLVSVFGDRVAKYKFDASYINKRCTVYGWSKSKYVEKKDTGDPMYIVNIEIADFELVA